jgi:hypothetical protein
MGLQIQNNNVKIFANLKTIVDSLRHMALTCAQNPFIFLPKIHDVI